LIERRRHPDPAYLLCPPCGLTIKARLPSLAVEHWPRCIARSRVAVMLSASTGRRISP
jgi:hypothetical protein